MIDLEPAYLDEVRRILGSYVPGVEVWAFGSRVTGKSEKFSDLDLALAGPDAVDPRLVESLKDAFSESDLPILVDVVDVNSVSPAFRRVIQRGYEVIYTPNLLAVTPSPQAH
ncbi:MAG: nucleotidyltransferase domain-containing protein [Nitrospirae bacterium]|nr:nucleotidyltransferase domain-containing protein [Nitrospirota bacterium]MBI5695349.1 nucleotidyltransferase domain-containing protein [Nitrospirota bacterium]